MTCKLLLPMRWAQICEVMGADVWKVRSLVNKSPTRAMHLPGAGVGGHCIPKDPWLLAYGVYGSGLELSLVPSARSVNDSMPRHMADLTAGALAEAGKGLKGARILVLGYAYLENSDDTRNSPSRMLVDRLESLGAAVSIHDPFVEEYRRDVYQAAQGCDAVILMTAHSMYSTLDMEKMKKNLNGPVLVDGRGVFMKEKMTSSGWIYRGVGIG